MGRVTSQHVLKGYSPVWLALVNSEQWDGFGHLTDHLENPVWLKTFLRRAGLASLAEGPVPEEDLRRLRARLRRVVETVATGKRLSPAECAGLDAWLAQGAQRRFLSAHGGGYRISWEPLKGGWPWILAMIAASAAETLAEGDLRRVKVCPNAGCRWAFYDQTHGNRRRWCNDRACGNRDKVRRFRARQTRTDGTGSRTSPP